MTALVMKLTDAGRAALVNAQQTGTAAVLIAAVGLTDQPFAPAADTTVLPGEYSRLTAVGGETLAADTIHVTVSDDSAATYTVRGFAVYLDDGTLFASYSQADPILEKAAASLLLLVFDAVFVDADVSSVTFGAASFSDPPATTERQGVVQLATPDEAVAGTDTTRAVTPSGLAAASVAAARWQVLPAGAVLPAGVRLIPDNAAGACTYTLPAAPADGDVIEWRQGETSFSDSSVTFARAGHTIMGLGEDMTVDDPTACGGLVWREALNTWWVYATGLAGVTP